MGSCGLRRGTGRKQVAAQGGTLGTSGLPFGSLSPQVGSPVVASLSQEPHPKVHRREGDMLCFRLPHPYARLAGGGGELGRVHVLSSVFILRV